MADVEPCPNRTESFHPILAIDPGPEQSAWLVYDRKTKRIRKMDIEPNPDVLARVFNDGHNRQAALLAVEMVQSFGMPVGADVFETVLWTGRFVEAWGGPWARIYRKDVKLHLCGSPRAKDPNIRQALLDRFPRSGGGKTPQVGTKKEPGPLHGCRSHIWSALAVAITAAETAE